jgi:hypothetical protein
MQKKKNPLAAKVARGFFGQIKTKLPAALLLTS